MKGTDEKKVLIIDDDEFIRIALKDIIEDNGYLAVTSRSAEDGLQIIIDNSSDSFHLIFLDLKMPNMNGVEFLDELKKYDSNIPIIVISAHSENIYRDAFEKHNIFEFVKKPFDNETIINLVNKCFQKIKY